MKVYMVEITETLQLSVDCKADSAEEAEAIVCSRYNAGAYVLDAGHFTGVDFSASEKKGDFING